MDFTGGCYCGALRYHATGKPLFKALCHCQHCQIFSGGMAALLVGMPKSLFTYTQGQPAVMPNQSNSESEAQREFCGHCGTHILALADSNPEMVSIKAGTMDDISLYGSPEMALQMDDSRAFHTLPEGIAQYPRWPWS